MAYYRQPGCGLGGCGGCLLAMMVLGVAFTALALATMVLVAIGAALYLIARYLFAPQERPFGAWPQSRWSMTWEHLLFQLEGLTRFDTNSTPLRIFISSVVVGLVPTIILGWFFGLFYPPGSTLLPALGLLAGGLSALALSRTPNWFVGHTVDALDDGLPLLPNDRFLLDADDW